jgi:hypothetical protein
VTTGSIHQGDVIRCNVRGDRFWAEVTQELEFNSTLNKKVIRISSLTNRPIPTHMVTAVQIIGHWRKKKGSEV